MPEKLLGMFSVFALLGITWETHVDSLPAIKICPLNLYLHMDEKWENMINVIK